MFYLINKKIKLKNSILLLIMIFTKGLKGSAAELPV